MSDGEENPESAVKFQLKSAVMKKLAIPLAMLLIGCHAPQKTTVFKPYEQRERALVQSVGFSPDGNKLYITLFHQLIRKQAGDTSNAYPEVAIYEADKVGDKWSDPSLLSFSGKYEDYEPTVSPDGNYIFYNSNRPLTKGDKPFSSNNIWYVERRGGAWSEPVYCTAINNREYGEDYPAITRTNKIYFMKELPSPKNDSVRNYKIYVTAFPGTGTTTPVQVFAGNENEGDPWVSPRESYLVFTKFDLIRGWDTTCDLYISFRKNNKWSTPQPIGDLNTPGKPDYAVTVSPDEKWIYYRANHSLVKKPFKQVLKKYSREAVFS